MTRPFNQNTIPTIVNTKSGKSIYILTTRWSLYCPWCKVVRSKVFWIVFSRMSEGLRSGYSSRVFCNYSHPCLSTTSPKNLSQQPRNSQTRGCFSFLRRVEFGLLSPKFFWNPLALPPSPQRMSTSTVRPQLKPDSSLWFTTSHPTGCRNQHPFPHPGPILVYRECLKHLCTKHKRFTSSVVLSLDPRLSRLSYTSRPT